MNYGRQNSDPVISPKKYRKRSNSDTGNLTYRRKDNNILNELLRNKFYRRRMSSLNDGNKDSTMIDMPLSVPLQQRPTIVIDSPEENHKQPVSLLYGKNGALFSPFNFNRCSDSTGYHSGGSELSMNQKEDVEQMV